MTPRSAKATGRRLQTEAAATIAAALGLPPQDVRPAVGGENGADVKLSGEAARRFPFAVECACQERLSVWAKLAQAERHTAGTALTPLVIVRRNRGRAWACLPLAAFLAQAATPPCGPRLPIRPVERAPTTPPAHPRAIMMIRPVPHDALEVRPGICSRCGLRPAAPTHRWCRECNTQARQAQRARKRPAEEAAGTRRPRPFWTPRWVRTEAATCLAPAFRRLSAALGMPAETLALDWLRAKLQGRGEAWLKDGRKPARDARRLARDVARTLERDIGPADPPAAPPGACDASP